jgi:hypothetical protein
LPGPGIVFYSLSFETPGLYDVPIEKLGSFLILEFIMSVVDISYSPGPGILSFLLSIVFNPITYLGPSAILEGNVYIFGPGVSSDDPNLGLVDDPNPHAAVYDFTNFMFGL